MADLRGKTVVFAGRLTALTLAEATAIAKALGATVGRAVTVETGLVVCGLVNGTPFAGLPGFFKTRVTKGHDVPVIDEAAFAKMGSSTKVTARKAPGGRRAGGRGAPQRRPTKGIKARNSIQRFSATMDWFDVAEQPGDMRDLPKAFAEAARLWGTDRKSSFVKVIKLMTPYLRASFLPANINAWRELFLDREGDGLPEYNASKVTVVGIDFSSAPIPKCRAEAQFEVPVTAAFASTDLGAWQDANDRFAVAISFSWDIPRNRRTRGLDFSWGDNQGAECEPST